VLTLHIVLNDITKEKVDVITNVCSNNWKL